MKKMDAKLIYFWIFVNMLVPVEGSACDESLGTVAHLCEPLTQENVDRIYVDFRTFNKYPDAESCSCIVTSVVDGTFHLKPEGSTFIPGRGCNTRLTLHSPLTNMHQSCYSFNMSISSYAGNETSIIIAKDPFSTTRNSNYSCFSASYVGTSDLFSIKCNVSDSPTTTKVSTTATAATTTETATTVTTSTTSTTTTMTSSQRLTTGTTSSAPSTTFHTSTSTSTLATTQVQTTHSTTVTPSTAPVVTTTQGQTTEVTTPMTSTITTNTITSASAMTSPQGQTSGTTRGTDGSVTTVASRTPEDITPWHIIIPAIGGFFILLLALLSIPCIIYCNRRRTEKRNDEFERRVKAGLVLYNDINVQKDNPAYQHDSEYDQQNRLSTSSDHYTRVYIKNSKPRVNSNHEMRLSNGSAITPTYAVVEKPKSPPKVETEIPQQTDKRASDKMRVSFQSTGSQGSTNRDSGTVNSVPIYAVPDKKKPVTANGLHKSIISIGSGGSTTEYR